MFFHHLSFEGATSTAWLAVCVVAGLATLAGVWLLLRAPRKLVSRRTGLALLALRIAVAGLFVIAVLRPVVDRGRSLLARGRIVVAVDVSESMETADPQASSAEKLRWARALGMIGNAENRARVDEWIAAFDAGRQPDWLASRETDSPQRASDLAQSRQQFVNETLQAIDAMSRRQIAVALLQNAPHSLLTALDNVGDVETCLFAGRAQYVERTLLGSLSAHNPADLQVATTSLAAALSQATEGPGGEKCLGIILLTDGRDTATGTPGSARASAGGINPDDINPDSVPCPVFPIVIGCENPPRDLSVVAVESPRRAARGESPLVTATLATAGFAGEVVSVVLEPADNSAPLKKSVTAAGDRTEVRFELPPREPGRAEYTLRIEPHPHETRHDDNARSFSIDVDDARQNVLLVDGDARWEFRLLHNILSRDPAISVHAVVFRQPYLGLLDAPFFERTLAPAERTPAAPAKSAIDQADLIVIGDVGPNEIAPADWERIEKFVSESGGTLVLSAGRRFFPLAHKNPVVERLLPLTQPRVVTVDEAKGDGTPSVRGFHLALTDDGARETFLTLNADNADGSVWRNLPGHTWGIFGEPKPAASVLVRAINLAATSLNDRPNSARPQDAVVIAQYYGAGRVVWIGIDSTWRWRVRDGQSAHEKFWGQLVRWSAQQKRSAPDQVVDFSFSKHATQADDNVLRARFSAEFLKRFPSLAPRAEIFSLPAAASTPATTDAPAPVATVTLIRVADEQRDFQARLDTLPPGNYRAVLSVPEASLGPQPVTAAVEIDSPISVERRDLRTNRQLLSQLAQRTGGRLLGPDDAHQVVSLIETSASRAVVQQALPLWNHWVTLALILLLLTAEWALRKQTGLP